MMASCVSYLYRNSDSNPLIMPANLPLRDQSLAAEFDRLLPGNWGPVITEADSDGSRTDRIDETTRFGQVGGAAKRVARAIFVVVLANGETTIQDNSQNARLVILPPDKAINSRSAETNDAETEVRRVLLTNPSGGNRIHRNTLLFLTAKGDEVRNLRQAVCHFLAWQSITQVRNGDDRRISGLSEERANQANAGLRSANSAISTALVAAYRWALAPSQPAPQDASRIQLTEFRTNVTDQGEIVNAAFSRFIEEEALVEKISPASLARLLQERVWGTSIYGDHIDVNALWEMLTSYVYLPRLRNRSVLHLCIEEGVVAGAFGYARDFNPDTGEYRGLRYEGPLHDPALGMVINENSGGLLVAPGRAAEEKRKELDRRAKGYQEVAGKAPTRHRGFRRDRAGGLDHIERARHHRLALPIPHPRKRPTPRTVIRGRSYNEVTKCWSANQTKGKGQASKTRENLKSLKSCTKSIE